MRAENTRTLIVEAADQLFYQQGFEHTSFADIADAVQISRGNFYYHFRTKDEILDAVIERRLTNTQAMLACWEQAGETPVDRLRSFAGMLIANRAPIMRYGCPVGTLCSELAKLDHVSKPAASQLFTLFRTWLCRQFVLVGCVADADDLAMHLLVRSQGIATLASAFQDDVFVDREVACIHDWIDTCCQRARSAG